MCICIGVEMSFLRDFFRSGVFSGDYFCELENGVIFLFNSKSGIFFINFYYRNMLDILVYK